MRAFKFKIIEKKFPFLGDFVAIRKPQHIEVKKAGADLLDRVGWRNSYHWSGGEYLEYEFFTVFDGTQLHDVPYAGSYTDGSGHHNEWDGMAIGEFCFEKGLRPQIVVALNRTEADSCGNGTPSISMTIYQLENINWDEYFAVKLKQAEQELGLGLG